MRFVLAVAWPRLLAAEVPGGSVSTREESDALGRLVKVVENAGVAGGEVTTDYAHDAGDRLTSVSGPSEAGTQTRLFTYDNGRTFYTDLTNADTNKRGYDSRGHGRRKITGPFDFTISYDPAERVTSVSESGSGRLLKEFAYDAACTRFEAAPPLTGTVKSCRYLIV